MHGRGGFHDILKIPPPIALLFSFAFVTGFALLFLICNLFQNPLLRDGDDFYFVDADCYSRMTRARILADVPPFAGREEARSFPFLRQHFFENFPFGTRPHTTAPMDFAILGIWKLLGGQEARFDLAGWVVSPILGVFLIFLAWGLSCREPVPYRWSGILLLGVSPILLHGFAFGRPDHQSLLLFFVGGAILMESEFLRSGNKWVSVFSGVFWGMGFWVSWFEPLVLWGVTQIFYGVRSLVGKEAGKGAGFPAVSFWVALGFAALVVLLEGVPSVGVPEGMREIFFRWAGEIGELRAIPPWDSLPEWCGWFALGIPFFLAWKAAAGRSAQSAYLLVLFIVLAGLSWWMVRWGYFLAVAVAAGTPFALSVIRWRFVGYGIFIAGLWPVAASWETRFFPGEKAGAQAVAKARELRELRLVATALQKAGGGAVLAPWWHTPALVYWSGKDGVAGSSHQSLSGIADSARFFLSEDNHLAFSVLEEREGVGFVVAGNPEHALENSRAILGKERTEKEEETEAFRLFFRPREEGSGLRVIYATPSFRLYEKRRDPPKKAVEK